MKRRRKNADFLAQTNQEGSGTKEENEITTPVPDDKGVSVAEAVPQQAAQPPPVPLRLKSP